MAPPMIPAHAAAFLARHGWAGASVAVLAADASFRRYFRVAHSDGARTAVLMDAPPAHEDARAFLAIAAHLDGIGLSAPRILAAEPDAGLVLLEDYGDRRLTPLLETRPDLEPALYATAIDILAQVQHAPPPPGLHDYDLNELRREVLLFTDWYLPTLGTAADPGSFLDAWNGAFAYAVGWPGVLVLRDYHADNLMWLADRAGARALGLLDFQDARVGQRAYDLVSLLQDARRDVAPGLGNRDDRTFSRPHAIARTRALRRELRRARRTAADQDPGHLRAPLETRRQARLPPLHGPRLGAPRTRSRAPRAAACRALVRSERARPCPCRRLGRTRMSVPVAAMVLAAGLGKRMRPLTATRPKPLVEVAGAALLDHALARLAAEGVARAVVNVHYMAERVEAHLAARAPGLEIRISDERAALLETGGGGRKSAAAHRRRPLHRHQFGQFLDRRCLPDAGRPRRPLGRRPDGRAAPPRPPRPAPTATRGAGDFHMDAGGALRRRAGGRVAPWVFSGVQILSRRLFDGVAVEPFSLNRLYDTALAQGRLHGAAHTGLWFHVGTPQAVAETEAVLAHG